MKKAVTFSLGLFSLLGLIKIFSVIPFNRFSDDDFGFLGTAAFANFWKTQASSYMMWTGRFTSTFLQTIFGYTSTLEGKPVFYSIITFLLLILAFAVFYSRFLKLKLWNLRVIILSCLSFITLYILTPNKAESWYWMTGSITYLWPIIFLIFGISGLGIVPSFFFIFLSVAGNEAFGLLTLAVLAGITIYSFLNKRLNKTCLVMTVAAAISFALVYFAPGNTIREGGGGSNPMNWFGSFAYAIQTGPGYLYALVSKNILLLLPLVVTLAYYFSELKPKNENKEILEKELKNIFAVAVAAVGLGILYMFPAFKILGRVPPDRSDITLSFVILAAVTFSAYRLSKVFSIAKVVSSWIFAVAVFLSAFLIISSAFSLMSTFASDVYTAKNYSDAFDGIKFQPGKSPAKLPDSGLIAPLRLQYQWVRTAASNYYEK